MYFLYDSHILMKYQILNLTNFILLFQIRILVLLNHFEIQISTNYVLKCFMLQFITG